MHVNASKLGRTNWFLRVAPTDSRPDDAPGPAVTRDEEIAAVRAGRSLPMARLAQTRFNGMEAIQREFISRLVHSDAPVDTLSIYWERAHEFVSTGELEGAARKLVFGRRHRVTGEFRDLWLVCYPDDPDAKVAVDREIDHMVRKVAALAVQRRQ